MQVVVVEVAAVGRHVDVVKLVVVAAAETVVVAKIVVALPLIDEKEWNASAPVVDVAVVASVVDEAVVAHVVDGSVVETVDVAVVAPVVGTAVVETVDVVDTCYMEAEVLVQMLALEFAAVVVAIVDMVQCDAA